MEIETPPLGDEPSGGVCFIELRRQPEERTYDMGLAKNRRERKPEFLSIRDFDQLQHYRNRSLVWVKTYCATLDDYEFQKLPDASKWHLIGLTLLAARMGNRLPNDISFLERQIGANTPVDVDLLLSSGFLIPFKLLKTKNQFASKTLADPRQDASPDEKRLDKEETRRETHTEQNNADATSAFVVGVCADEGSENSRNNPLIVAAPGLQLVATEGSERSQGRGMTEGSHFSIDECLRYVEHCQSMGQVVRSPKALATKLHQTGSADIFIEQFLSPPPTIKEKAKSALPPDPTCEICAGAGMVAGQPCLCRLCQICQGSGFEVIKGKGARPCACRSRAA